MKPSPNNRHPLGAKDDLRSAQPSEIANMKGFQRAVSRVKEALIEGGTSIDKSPLIWIKAIQNLASTYDMKTLQFKRTNDDESKFAVRDRLLVIEHYLKAIDLDIRVNDAIIHDNYYIELNDDWKTRATTYVSHIRDVVSKAEVVEAIRERIFKRLNDLQGELDKNRTRVEAMTEVFLSITEAVSKGAKHLDPAVKLVERLAGALSGARTSRIEHDAPLQLPPPEQLGLPDPE